MESKRAILNTVLRGFYRKAAVTGQSVNEWRIYEGTPDDFIEKVLPVNEPGRNLRQEKMSA